MDERPTHLDLFSGIGGFALAAQWAGFRTIGFCEIDKYCQKVLAKNFMGNSTCSHSMDKPGSVEASNEERWLQESDRPSEFPRIIPNIFDLDGRQFAGVHLITGGFPCQPFSIAGKRRGAADDRAIWPQMFRVIGEARPAWVLGENVAGIIPMELDNVLSDLEAIGYSTRAFVVGAVSVDAPHRRQRVWIVANATGRRLGQREPQRESAINPGQTGERAALGHAQRSGLPPGESRSRKEGTARGSDRLFQSEGAGDVADGDGEGLEGSPQTGDLGEARSDRNQLPSGRDGVCVWPSEQDWFAQSRMGRVAHGIPSRVDRLKGLGNAIVPAVAFEILKPIYDLIMETRKMV